MCRISESFIDILLSFGNFEITEAKTQNRQNVNIPKINNEKLKLENNSYL
jgi:hypothetical protein